MRGAVESCCSEFTETEKAALGDGREQWGATEIVE